MSHTLITPDSQAKSHTRPRGTSFLGLVGVELRRLWWRRLTKAVLVGVVAFTGLMVYNVYNQSSPESLAQRLDEYQAMVADAERQKQEMEANLPTMIAECREQETAERERANDASIDFGCEQIGEFQVPTMEEMGISLPIADTITAELVPYATFAYAFLALLLMGSFVAAEFSTGALGNWLTFKPQRVRVALSKLAAAGVGGALAAGLGLGLLVLGARMVATINRPDADLQLPAPPALEDSVAQLLLRAVLVVVAAGLLGASLGLLLRHTAGLVGLLLGYLVVVEFIAVQAFLGGRLTPWAIMPNANAFLSKGHEYMAETCTTVDGNPSCTFGIQEVSYTHGWIYLLVLVLGLSTAAVLVFRRRDVT
jgi:ABC-2 type transport system permease protein